MSLYFIDDVYTKKPWFQFLKQRWATNHDELEKFFVKIMLRHNETGDELPKKYERFPGFYRYHIFFKNNSSLLFIIFIIKHLDLLSFKILNGVSNMAAFLKLSKIYFQQTFFR